MVSSALILLWMTRLSPNSPQKNFPEIAEAIAKAANEDADPLDAAAILTAIGRCESNFDLYARSKPEDTTVSLGIFQISTQWILFPASAYQQASIALFLVRDSQKRCGDLSEYTSGSCSAGQKAADEWAGYADRLKSSYFVDYSTPIGKHGESNERAY